MSALVAVDRHLWLNLMGIKDRDKVFLLDASVLPSALFGDSMNTITSRFQEVKRHEEDVQFLPHCAQGEWL